ARVPVAAPRAGGRDRLRALGARLRRAGGAVRRPVRRPGPGHAPGGAARARGGGRGLARLEPAQATTRPVRRDPVMAPAGGGRLVRGGRVVARVLLVWVLAVGALRLLDEWLVGFAMPQWWQPTVCALLFGLLSAVVWPLVLRVALPVAVFTLGIGSFLLLGAGVLAISFAVPGVVVTDLGTAVVVAVAVAALGSVVSSVVGLDEDELFFRRAARRGAKECDESVPPGVLLLQIDGLGIDTLRRAVRTGDMPAVARLLDSGSHRLVEWHTDWSSQTGAAVAGILHGDNHDIVGFRWYEKERDHVVVCSSPEDAAEIERRHSDGRGLLAVDGAARASLF